MTQAKSGAVDHGQRGEAAGVGAQDFKGTSKVTALYNGPLPRRGSLLCLAQRSFPLCIGAVPNAALRNDRVSDFELSIRFAIEPGCVSGTIKLLRNGFADWAKEGHVEAHLFGAIRLGAISKSYQADDKVHKSSEI